MLVLQEGRHIFELVVQDLFDVPEVHLHTLYSCLLCGSPKLNCEFGLHHSNKTLCFQPLNDRNLEVAYDLAVLQGGKKDCSCPERKVSCLSEGKWLSKMLGVRRYSYSAHDDLFRKYHPAVMPIAMAKDLIETFSHRGEFVLDPFCGTGTTIEAAEELGRIGIGYDINPKFISIAGSRVKKGYVLSFESHKGWKFLRGISLSLILTSPPYSNILSRPQTERSRKNRGNLFMSRAYSNFPEDLGNMDRLSCLKSVVEVIKNYIPFLKSGGHVLINVPDYFYDRETKKLVAFSSLLVDGLERAGLMFKNKIIWDRSHFFMAEGKPNYGMFGYPSNFLVLSGSYEVILDFEKP